jgi:hypothetical protein
MPPPLREFLRAPQFADPARTRAAQVLHRLLWLLIVAGVLTLPLYVAGEGSTPARAARVMAINGGTVIAMLALVLWLRAGKVELVGGVLVWGLLLLIGWLAETNGEPIQGNVINFVLVLVVAAFVFGRGAMIALALVCVAAMLHVAYRQGLGAPDMGERMVESAVQFVPAFAIITWLLLGVRRQ